METNKQPIINVQYVEQYVTKPATPFEVISGLIFLMVIAALSGVFFR